MADYAPPYIVAELNTSHFGDLAIAKAMIEQAHGAGCDCVKVQSWTSETLYSETFYRANPIARRFTRKFSLRDSQLIELSQHAQSVGIDFASTPYSVDEARFLVEDCLVPFVKIASMELDNLPFLARLGDLGVPLVLSTGMGTHEDIVAAVDTIVNAGNRDVVILHCRSVYPSPPEDCHLHNIVSLRNAFPAHPIGYSDHSLGFAAPIAAVALGACLIEKHFTLDRARIGMDNHMAIEPDEMRALVRGCREAQLSLGQHQRVVDETELLQRSKMRRSIVTAHPLPEGHTLMETDLCFKRPGTGYSIRSMPQIVGRRLACDIAADEILLPEHLEPT